MLPYDSAKFKKYILYAYSDLAEPDYRFVGAALGSAQYSEIGTAFVDKGFTVQDDTEPNTDVCRTLILSKDGGQACVKLSFVGPFAAVFILTRAPSMQGISPALNAHGLEVLPNGVLVQPFGTDPFAGETNPVLYNLLFSWDSMPTEN